MRMGTVVEVVGGFALVLFGCFSGPDWPPSVPNEEIHVPTTGGGAAADGGTSGDSGVTEFDASSGFACDFTALNSTCQYYTGVPLAAVQQKELDCTSQQGKVLPGCPTSACSGCCTISGGPTGSAEDCYYMNGIYTPAFVMANCISPGVFSAGP